MVSELSVAAQRAQQILQELLRTGKVIVDDLAQSLEVSAATIRRDLAELERRGLLRRTHGGASSIEPALYEPFRNVSSFQEQEQQLTAEKRRIGLAPKSSRTERPSPSVRALRQHKLRAVFDIARA